MFFGTVLYIGESSVLEKKPWLIYIVVSAIFLPSLMVFINVMIVLGFENYNMNLLDVIGMAFISVLGIALSGFFLSFFDPSYWPKPKWLRS